MKKIIYIFLAFSFVFYACKKEEGCTDPTAFNYDANAETDDGSCILPVYGCTDVLALNYDPLANLDDSSCLYAPSANVYDTLEGLWTLTHYDMGSGLIVADTGQYINFLDNIELLVNIQVTGWTWYGSFNYTATSDSINTMNQDIAILNLNNQNMNLRRVGFSFDYDLYFEK